MIITDQYNAKAIAKLKELEAEGWSKIVLLGSPGVGKTYLARSLVKHDYFLDEPEFKQHIVAGNARLRAPEEALCWPKGFPLEALAKYPSVIYDDYGSADLSPAYVEKTLYWLNERAKWKDNRTLFTSNLTLEELYAREGRIASRILENAVVLVLSGQDRRKIHTKIINC